MRTTAEPGSRTDLPGDRIEGEPSDWVLVIDSVPTGRYQYRNDAESASHATDLPIITNPGYGATTGLPRRG